MKTSSFILGLLLLCGTTASSQDGILDTTFGRSGVASATLISGCTMNDAIRQPDGKILMAGYAEFKFFGGAERHVAVLRFDSTGKPDPTWGNRGVVTTKVTGTSAADAAANAIALQPDGKVVVAGFYLNGTLNHFVTVRYFPDGSIDGGFGSSGIVKTTFTSSYSEMATGVAVQADGKIVVGGTSGLGGSNVNADFVMVRLTSTGAIDNTFGSSGKVTTNVGTAGDLAQDLALQPDGKIILAGYSSVGSNHDFSMVRYKTNGQRDSTFGVNGIVTTPFGTSNDRAYSCLLQPDGKILLGGSAFIGSTSDYALARYTASGTLDNTFGSGGKTTTVIGIDTDEILDMALLANGKIIAGGYTDTALVETAAIVCYNANGTVDNSFGSAGKVVKSDPSLISERVHAILALSGSRILVSNYRNNSFSSQSAGSKVYSSSGQIQTAYGENGIATAEISETDDVLGGMVLHPNKRFYAVGYSKNNSSNEDVSLTSFTYSGELNKSFGVNGRLFIPIGTAADAARGMVVQADGKLVIAGDFSNGTNSGDFFVVRIDTNGTLDNTYGTGGIAKTTVTTSYDYMTCMLIQPDGKVVVGGYSYVGAYYHLTLVRYNTNGTLDNTFGTGGIVKTTAGANITNWGFGITLQPDGKIVMCGMTSGSNTQVFVRYNTNGTPDNTFGTGGIVNISINANSMQPFGLAVQPDGKIVYVGHETNSGTDVVIGRLLANGSIDNSFGTSNGYTSVNPGNFDYARNVLVEATGKLLVSVQTDQNTKLLVLRFNATGLIDSTFGTNGIAETPSDMTGSSYAIPLVKDISTGRIFIAGSFSDAVSTMSDHAIVCFNSAATTGITKNGRPKMESILSIYPNPACDHIRVEGTGLVSVFDLQGKELLAVNLEDTSGMLGIAHLAPGMYLVQVVTAEGISTGRFIKN